MELTSLERELGATVLAPYAASIAGLAKPSIAMKVDPVKPVVPEASRLGGMPFMPENIAWPVNEAGPLSFLCQLNFSEISQFDEQGILPREGDLYLFYDEHNQPWGFDPKHRSGWKAIYLRPSDYAVHSRVQREPPEGPPPSRGFLGAVAGFFRGEHPGGGLITYRPAPVAFAAVASLPPVDSELLKDFNFDDQLYDAYSDWLDGRDEQVFGPNSPVNHLLGYPAPVQNDSMEEESQMAFHGIYMGDATYDKSKAEALRSGIQDWLLLLELDSIEQCDMMWGDAGKLYFWIRKQDLARADFSNVWLILQCC